MIPTFSFRRTASLAVAAVAAVALFVGFGGAAQAQGTTYTTTVTYPADGQQVPKGTNNLETKGTVVPDPAGGMGGPTQVMVYINQVTGGTAKYTSLGAVSGYDATKNQWTFDNWFSFMGGLPSGSYEVYAVPMNSQNQQMGPKFEFRRGEGVPRALRRVKFDPSLGS